MSFEVEYTDEFEDWWNSLDEQEQGSVDSAVGLLERLGPRVPFPHSSGIQGSRHGHMRELRIQHQGRPYRVLYAFDPRRAAILLQRYVPFADALYDTHLREIAREAERWPSGFPN
jgi:hypothetical protein